MIRVKLVMVGAPGVGKSSLVRRFVHSIFSEEYHSTLGVKVDRKTVTVGDAVVTMLVWDMHGEAEGLVVPDNYLRGAGATLAVFDSANPATIDAAAEMLERVRNISPDTYGIAVANKADLSPSWPEVEQAAATIGAAAIHRTSAKTGDGVDEVFGAVASEIRDRSNG